ncbi:DUF192 domain-containing protein [Candidatus Gracilibacteria bacterium]|nr:DUF192 domain-containing protein [Candidatus Gracilibacteria bacterium]
MKKNKYHQKLKAKAFEGTKNKIFSVIIIVLFFFIGMYGYRCLSEKVCEVESFNRFVRHDVTISTPHGAIVAEVADTRSSRELGLSGRESMKENEGLLFIFDTPGRYGFWMKDMIFPLDILWINQNGIVVEIERNVTPESYPKTYINASPATYVLELNAGIAEKQGLFIGSKVKIIE